MSTSINHSIRERALDIECAIMAQNPAELFRLAVQEMREGNEEQAEALMHIYEHEVEKIREQEEAESRGDEKEYAKEAENYQIETTLYPSEEF